MTKKTQDKIDAPSVGRCRFNRNNNKALADMKSNCYHFTEFNKLKFEYYDKMYKKNKKLIKFMVVGAEITKTTKKPHMQCFVRLMKQERGPRVKNKILKLLCHIEEMYSDEYKSSDYCKKDRKFKTYGEELKEKSQQGKRTDLTKVFEEIRNGKSKDEVIWEYTKLYSQYYKGMNSLFEVRDKRKSQRFRKIKMIILMGHQGTGKTRYPVDKHGYDKCFKVKKDGGNLFDGYRNEEIIIFDDFNTAYCKYTDMLQYLDGHYSIYNCKYGTIYPNWTTIYITSNRTPCLWWINLCLGKNMVRRFSKCIELTWKYPDKKKETEDKQTVIVNKKVVSVSVSEVVPKSNTIDQFLDEDSSDEESLSGRILVTKKIPIRSLYTYSKIYCDAD